MPVKQGRVDAAEPSGVTGIASVANSGAIGVCGARRNPAGGADLVSLGRAGVGNGHAAKSPEAESAGQKS